jgi:hypothetical protein
MSDVQQTVNNILDMERPAPILVALGIMHRMDWLYLTYMDDTSTSDGFACLFSRAGQQHGTIS